VNKNVRRCSNVLSSGRERNDMPFQSQSTCFEMIEACSTRGVHLQRTVRPSVAVGQVQQACTGSVCTHLALCATCTCHVLEASGRSACGNVKMEHDRVHSVITRQKGTLHD
jgi:hypothetical protein